jgi:hypothetical protein
MDKIYSIIKFKKVKENGELTAMAGHNFRLAKHESRTADIDQARTPLNRKLIDRFEVKKMADLAAGINGHYAALGIKERSNSVKALDFVLTTSPGYWGDWHSHLDHPKFKKKLDDWVKTQVEFMQKKFGADNIATAILHLDETTPHIHFLIMPVEEKEVKYKNRHSSGIKKTHTLNSKRYNPAFFKQLVTDYSAENAKYGLMRGVEGNGKNSISIKEYKNHLSREMLRVLKEHDEHNRQQIEQLTLHENKTNAAIEALKKANLEIRKMKEEAVRREFEFKKLLAIYEPQKLKPDDLTMLGL